MQNVEVIEISPTENAFTAVTFFGTLKHRRRIPLAFTQGGRVAKIDVVSGQEVTQGTVLAQTDIGDLDSQKSDVEAAIQTTQTNLNANQNSNDLRNRLSQLQRQLDDINREIDKATLKAPFDGTVSRRDVEPGQVVSAGMPVLDLTDNGDPVIEANVATAIANGMGAGDQVWVLIDDKPFRANVASVMPTKEGSSRTRTVKFDLAADQSTTALNAGDVVEIRFWSETNQSGFWLPWSVLQQQSSGLWTAMVVEENDDSTIASVRTLEVIRLQDDLALVKGALKPNDLLVVSGINRIVPGQTVIAEQVENEFLAPGPRTEISDATDDTDETDNTEVTDSENGEGGGDDDNGVSLSGPSP